LLDGDEQGWQAAMAEPLLAATTASASETDELIQTFKQDLKNALLERQQERLANQRLAAALANDFEMEATAGEQRLSGVTPGFRVKFHTSGRQHHTEEFTVMPKLLLKTVVEDIAKHPDHRENLRPFNMALFSPRFFWNLVRLNQVGAQRRQQS
jgi:hypothetical protein